MGNEIERRVEVAEQTTSSLQKMALGFLPGGHVVDEFLNFRSNLKQQRLLNFTDDFKNALDEIGGRDFDSGRYTTEEFVDVFESVIGKVLNSNSEYKLERFKNILVKQVVEPLQDPLILKYAALLESINEIQLILLEKMGSYNSPRKFDFSRLLVENNTDNPDFYYFLDKNHWIVKIGEHEVRTSRSDVDFYVAELVSFGLLIKVDEEKVTRISDGSLGGGMIDDKRIEVNHGISDMGRKFIQFIQGYGTDENQIPST